MSLFSLHVQECGWALPCVDFVQAVTAAVPLRVKQPFCAQKAALLTIPPASSCSFNSFCFFLVSVPRASEGLMSMSHLELSIDGSLAPST